MQQEGSGNDEQEPMFPITELVSELHSTLIPNELFINLSFFDSIAIFWHSQKLVNSYSKKLVRGSLTFCSHQVMHKTDPS